MITSRSARASWEGNLESGTGRIDAESSQAFGDLGITWKARAEGADGKTSPEELIAAAHAACFSMAFSKALSSGGQPPKRLDVRATVSFDPVKLQVMSSRLEVRGDVPGIDPAEFRKLAEAAKDGCPVSKALMGNVAIELDAKLES